MDATKQVKCDCGNTVTCYLVKTWHDGDDAIDARYIGRCGECNEVITHEPAELVWCPDCGDPCYLEKEHNAFYCGNCHWTKDVKAILDDTPIYNPVAGQATETPWYGAGEISVYFPYKLQNFGGLVAFLAKEQIEFSTAFTDTEMIVILDFPVSSPTIVKMAEFGFEFKTYPGVVSVFGADTKAKLIIVVAKLPNNPEL